jgi:hypothetical protein
MTQQASSLDTIGCHHLTLPSLATYEYGVIPALVGHTSVGIVLLMDVTKVLTGYEDVLACSGLEWLNVYCIFMKTLHSMSAVFKYKIETGGFINRLSRILGCL